MIDWRFVLVDRVTDTEITELTNARDRSISFALNRPGSLQFTLDMLDSDAELIAPVTTYVRGIRNGSTIWSGPVWTVQESLPTSSMAVMCAGWFEFLNHRIHIPASSTTFTQYTATDAGAVAQAILALTNGVSPTGITAGTTETTIVRTKRIDRFANVGAEIVALSDVENGFDFAIDPTTRRLNISASIGADLPDIVFGYNFGPHNIETMSRSQDSSSLSNNIYVQGSGQTVGPIPDSTSISTYGRFDELISGIDVRGTNISTLLTAYGNAEIVYRAIPKQTFEVVPVASGGQTPFLPFDDYNVGDSVRLTARHGSLDIQDQAIRLFGMTVTINDNGTESVSSLQLTAN